VQIVLLSALFTIYVVASPVSRPESERTRIPILLAEDLLDEQEEAKSESFKEKQTSGLNAISNEGFEEIDQSSAIVQEMALFAAAELPQLVKAGPLYLLKVTYAEVQYAVGSNYKLSMEMLSFGGTKRCDVLISDSNCSADNCPWTDSRRLVNYECN
jgi:hypothetical protein